MFKLIFCTISMIAIPAGFAVFGMNATDRNHQASVAPPAEMVANTARGESPLSAVDYPGYDVGRDIYGNSVR